jgi:hypothetical protein
MSASSAVTRRSKGNHHLSYSPRRSSGYGSSAITAASSGLSEAISSTYLRGRPSPVSHLNAVRREAPSRFASFADEEKPAAFRAARKRSDQSRARAPRRRHLRRVVRRGDLPALRLSDHGALRIHRAVLDQHKETQQ